MDSPNETYPSILSGQVLAMLSERYLVADGKYVWTSFLKHICFISATGL